MDTFFGFGMSALLDGPPTFIAACDFLYLATNSEYSSSALYKISTHQHYHYTVVSQASAHSRVSTNACTVYQCSSLHTKLMHGIYIPGQNHEYMLCLSVHGCLPGTLYGKLKVYTLGLL